MTHWDGAAPANQPDIRGVSRREGDGVVAPVPRVKLVLLGDSVSGEAHASSVDASLHSLLTNGGFVQGVGKSCLVLRYVRGQFDPSSKVTVGAAFMSHSVKLPSGATIKFEIWYVHACNVRLLRR